MNEQDKNELMEEIYTYLSNKMKEDTKLKNIKRPISCVKDVLFIENNSELIFDTVSIYDLLGKLALNQKIINNSIDLSTLSQGTWILSIKTANNRIAKKLIKI